MGNIFYNTFVVTILVFPWSVLGFMVAGAVWEKLKVGDRVRGEQ